MGEIDRNSRKGDGETYASMSCTDCSRMNKGRGGGEEMRRTEY